MKGLANCVGSARVSASGNPDGKGGGGRRLGWLCVLAALSSCASLDDRVGAGNPASTHFVQIPLIDGWHDGQKIQYITTDVSDRNAATMLGANYAPRLVDAIPEQPRAPGQASVLERLYTVTNFTQVNIAPSSPTPVGAASTDRAYSPLWQMYEVSWLPGAIPRTLRSANEVLEAADRGEVSVKATQMVVNCAIVFSEKGGLLPGTRRIARTN